ncbi:MAG: DUF86 domain-containing protein [Candidatus Micrarchaeota archaeon]|nr:DUF86 domain-containing protein [Candidatus Micrarchaeota archaeon]
MRKARYMQKLNELKDRIEFIENRIGWKEEFLENRILRKAIYKEFQETVEIVSDIAAMLVKDFGFAVEDDYKNLEIIGNKLGFEEKLVVVLKKAHGLRNVLVHEYNGIIDQQAYESMVDFLPFLKKFEKTVRKWIENSSKE